MEITVVGAGAMGGSYGGLLGLAGHEVCLIDAWQAHVDAIKRDGLRVDGVRGDHRVRIAASTGPIGDGADIGRRWPGPTRPGDCLAVIATEREPR
jgi:2-dehydropantoate 2-reductase